MQSSGWSCEECGLSFTRGEHYHRHLRTHTMEKPYACSECGSKFTRVDSLVRHLKGVHRKSYSNGLGERRRVIQACRSCHRSKLRCNGEQPCKRCEDKGATCSYRSSEEQVAIHEGNSDGPTPPKRQRVNPPSSEIAQPVLRSPALPTQPNTTTFSGNLGHKDPQMPDQENVVDLDMDLGLDLGTDIFPDLLDLPPPLNLFNGMWMTPIQSEGASESTPTSLTKPSQQSNPLIPDSVAEIYHQGYSPSTEAEAMEPRQYHPTDPSVDAQLSFPDMRQVHLDQVDQENFAHVPEIRQDTVDEVTKLARAMEYTPTFPPFTDLRVPPAPVINAWVQLYFEHFHPVFPVLHKASFGSAGTHWLLVFAVSAIGAQFSQLPQAHICSRAMNEVVRRQAIYLCEIQNRLGRELWMVQVILLNQIAMRYSGERRALEIAEFLQALPVTVARRKQLFTDVMSLTNMSSLDLSLQQKWQVWVLDEERRRTGFAIWLIDQACETHFDLTPIMRIEELQNSLPHEENRWETSNAQGWACSSHDPDTNSHTTLERVIIDGTWKSTWMKTGVLGKQTMLQVLTNAISNSQRPLTKLSAEPVMGREKAEIVLKDLLTTLGEEEPRLSTLGLKANSVHRMMIISTLMMSHIPGMSLFSTALRLKYKKCTATEMSYLTDKWNSVPHSRRLAVSYAAQLFGTIKNQACAHFSTPVMLFHATLTMWLYAALNIPPADMTVISERRSVVLSTLGPDDPEQFRWIESGRGCVKIPGVGNLLSSSACPRRLLDEAISLMRTLNHWGISRIYGQILSALCVE